MNGVEAMTIKRERELYRRIASAVQGLREGERRESALKEIAEMAEDTEARRIARAALKT